MAQKDLGAAKTSAFYSVVPFLGVLFSMVLLGERPGLQFYIALLIMIVGTIFIVKDTNELERTGEQTQVHRHERSDVNLVETHTHEHTQGIEHESHGHNHNSSNEQSHSAV